jgi:DNA-directed RNA polymerase subunit L
MGLYTNRSVIVTKEDYIHSFEQFCITESYITNSRIAIIEGSGIDPKEQLKKIANAFMDKAKAALKRVIEFINKIIDTIKEKLKFIKEKLNDVKEKIAEKIRDKVENSYLRNINDIEVTYTDYYSIMSDLGKKGKNIYFEVNLDKMKEFSNDYDPDSHYDKDDNKKSEEQMKSGAQQYIKDIVSGMMNDYKSVMGQDFDNIDNPKDVVKVLNDKVNNLEASTINFKDIPYGLNNIEHIKSDLNKYNLDLNLDMQQTMDVTNEVRGTFMGNLIDVRSRAINGLCTSFMSINCQIFDVVIQLGLLCTKEYNSALQQCVNTYKSILSPNNKSEAETVKGDVERPGYPKEDHTPRLAMSGT